MKIRVVKPNYKLLMSPNGSLADEVYLKSDTIEIDLDKFASDIRTMLFDIYNIPLGHTDLSGDDIYQFIRSQMESK